jgi:RimJ/RimL family protein N-acetyltransferase
MADEEQTAARPAPPYRIETPRLVLRPWEPADAPARLAAIEASRAHLSPWLSWARGPIELSHEVAALRRARGQFDRDLAWRYGVFDASSGAVSGHLVTHVAGESHATGIGYWLAAGYTGRGLCTEAVAALTQVVVRRLGFLRVVIDCSPANLRSQAVARRLGFREEGTLRNHHREADGSLEDTVRFSLLADELAASPAAAFPVRLFDGLGREIET